MMINPNLVEIASLIGDPSRLTILLNLLGGKALPAGELARSAQISPQTASTHLAKMIKGGLLVQESFGRHKYFRLATTEVATALEALLAISPSKPIRSLRESNQVQALQLARTCYDHLAGKLGVNLTDKLLEDGFLEKSGKDFLLTEAGKTKFKNFGIEVEKKRKCRRCFARQCLDWSERRYHLAGSLGASLTQRMFELNWIEYLSDGRAIRVTAVGKKGLFDEFGLTLNLE
ncbi:ArsR/SmtB family transcription factor [Sporomusa sphaeroides]|uniref:Helix-turn-helix domain protein n=1 Tax=Sporomusa sphaeroides DSM 2875 TaxID=1337886 RepID=A0ABM9WAK3_9FIRM|nr:winged helix-turn-helix domain-containing protein [Sporomusa sphaeroides]OLS57628.1 helix-turn-helix domain protein [Sporomusa sphaeroides DSM 2875]CVK21347.1 Helix-turn-helix domain protein [Sporomusa sphaeroides DSM 2875]